MRLGADSEEVYDEMIDKAIEEIEAKPKPPLLLQIVGYPIAILGLGIASVGLGINWVGRKLAGF